MVNFNFGDIDSIAEAEQYRKAPVYKMRSCKQYAVDKESLYLKDF